MTTHTSSQPIMMGDIIIAARALLNVPRADQARMAGEFLTLADQANEHRIRNRATHPTYGNGSLNALIMTASEKITGKPLPAEPFPTDPKFNLALQVMLDAVARKVDRAQDAALLVAAE